MKRYLNSAILRNALVGLTACALLIAGCKKKTAAPPAVVNTTIDAQSIEQNNRGVGLMGQFDYVAAHEVFNDLVDRHPDWLDAKVNLAIATFNRQSTGDEEQGLQLLGEVLEEDPDHLRAMYSRGVLLQMRGEMDEAQTLFERVAKDDRLDGYAAYFVGVCVEASDPESAVTWYETAISRDPYLRSAYYRLFQLLPQIDRGDEAEEYFDAFRKLEKNPRAKLVEIKYTRMGPKAMVTTADLPQNNAITQRPDGPLFLDPEPLLANSDGINWNPIAVQEDVRSITACDLDHDGDVDIFITKALIGDGLHNAVCINNGDNTFTIQTNHPLAAIPDVNAALWGDYDNDGRTDVYLCRKGANQLWKQDAQGAWQDVTGATGTDNGSLNTIDGALFDADHDGDLDIFCVNADGPNELLNNNLDGTFTPIAAQQGIAGDERASRQVLPLDIDLDRDTDLIVIHNQPPHDVFLNDRLWQYRRIDRLEDLPAADLASLITIGRDWAGQAEFASVMRNGDLAIWRFGEDSGQWHAEIDAPQSAPSADPCAAPLIATDISGDGNIDIIHPAGDSWAVNESTYMAKGGTPFVTWCTIVLDAQHGPAVVALAADGKPYISKPGPGRFDFATITLSGRVDEADSMRSNASGIGTQIAARIDSRWTIIDTLRHSTARGQSLQPVPIGLGGASYIDFVALDWTDGVYQTELSLQAGRQHHITETQRQLSSCPVLFAWNGHKFEFVSDILGVGGMGYMVAPHEYAPPRPWEKFPFPPDSLAPIDGRYTIKVMEPMEEACYLDAASIEVWDLPPGWQMAIDDRMNIAGTEPTGDALFYQREFLPLQAHNDRDEDVLNTVLHADLKAAPVGPIDERFIGRLQRTHQLTLEFGNQLQSFEGVPALIVDGWVEYPYSQTMFASWQAGASYDAPTLEARDADGQWHVVAQQFGYPAGMPRRMALPLNNLPASTTALRLSTNMEVYWDRIAIADTQSCERAVGTVIPPVAAHLAQTGFPLRTTGDQRLPHYDYDRRAPLWDTKWQAGWYTNIGPMTELVTHADGALAIFGPGDEIHIEFGPAPSAPETGWTRRFVLDARGWCKDMDLFTKDGDTLEPLPGSDKATSEARKLMEHLNGRFQSGR